MLNIDNPNLSQIALVLSVELIGRNISFSGISINSRSLVTGNLFIALKGNNFDGHNFIVAAKNNGAVAVITERKINIDLPQIIVKNSLQALQKLATAWRNCVAIPIIAITGSNGKTTVKEMTASILSQKSSGLKTDGNLNNLIGVPLTLLRLNSTHNWATIEMGVSEPNEIAKLVAIAQPTIGLITNISNAHQSGFGDIATTANTKSAIFAKLPKNGTAIMPQASPYLKQWQQLQTCDKNLTFGNNKLADVYFTNNKIYFSDNNITVNLTINTKHSYNNATAAVAIASTLNINNADIKAGLETTPTITGRLQAHTHNSGAIIIDDTYNASPASAKAAVDYLKTQPQPTVFVLGDMGELGNNANREHAAVGNYVKQCKISKLFTVGKLSLAASQQFNGQHFTNKSQLCKQLQIQLKLGATILIKGSRNMHMETVVNKLLDYQEVNQ